jgi:hypothetical protein
LFAGQAEVRGFIERKRQVILVVIQAVLGGKSMGYEYAEDILTSTVFGAVKYLSSNSLLIPFIESAFLYDEARTPFWQVLKNDGIDLRCYQDVEYVFWPFHPTYGEPDLIIIFQQHVHGEEDLLLIVEAKFKSPKSSTGEKVYTTIERLYSYYSDFEKVIADDLLEYMEKVGLRDFSGISCSDESLSYIFSRQYPVFFVDSKTAIRTSYFDQLPSTDFICNENIFFAEGE